MAINVLPKILLFIITKSYPFFVKERKKKTKMLRADTYALITYEKLLFPLGSDLTIKFLHLIS